MKKEAYIAAVQKIDLTDNFVKDTIAKLQVNQIDDNKIGNQDSNMKSSVIARKSKLFKAAAIILIMLISTTGITAAAARLSIVDVFQGFFKESITQDEGSGLQDSQNGAGTVITAVPLIEDNKFIEQASALVNSTTSANGLIFTARGVVGDKHNVYIAVDVQTEDASAFSKEQKNNIEGISFSKVWLKINKDALGQYCYITRIDDGSEIGKATYVLQNSLDITDEAINHLNIAFTNLTEPNTSSVIDLGTTKSVLDIMDEIGEASEDDFEYVGFSTSVEGYMDWYKDKRKQIDQELERQGITYKEEAGYDAYYGIVNKAMEEAIMKKGGFTPEYFIKRTEQQATFCTKYPDLAVSNLGIRNGQLVVKFEFNDSIGYDAFSDAGIILINKKNGEIIQGVDGGGLPVNGNDDTQSDIVNNVYISCNAQFSGITSKEELKDYYFAFGGDENSYKTIVEGEWTLDFDLSYKDTTRIYEVSKKINLGGYDRKLEQISLSPMSLQLQYSNTSKMSSTKDDADIIKIILVDNTEVVLDNSAWDEDSLNSVLPVIVDLETVIRIEINGEKIELK